MLKLNVKATENRYEKLLGLASNDNRLIGDRQ